MSSKHKPTRIVIMGAAGRDFHNFNMVYRDDPDSRVIAFTANQIPDIAGRRYPPSLAGANYPMASLSSTRRHWAVFVGSKLSSRWYLPTAISVMPR